MLMKQSVILVMIALVGMLIPSAAFAQGEKVTSTVELARAADKLKPGQWVWAPEIAPAGPVVVYVDLSRQIADVYRNGVRIGVSTVSTGKPGHETPTGVFKILQKDKWHHSSTYNSAPMYFQERLTWDGVALHAGGLPGYPESHGCVHLPYKFAEQLFGTTTMGGTVVVQGRAGAPVKIPAAGVLTPASLGGVSPGYRPLEHDEWRWTPEASPTGPVSIVISTTDNMLVALRNGVEIGRSRVETGGIDTSTHLATLTATSQGGFHWSLFPLPGHSEQDGHGIDSAALTDIRMPRAFMTRLRSIIGTGTHVLVTPAPINARTTAVPITVVSATD